MNIQNLIQKSYFIYKYLYKNIYIFFFFFHKRLYMLGINDHQLISNFIKNSISFTKNSF